ncbi:MAG: BadF/BadG/BcrA/BcrD ATPase family protein, partial [Spirochaetaceae bacterium]|nr:BadF/BadG/BcrA/BcrD ATPase family protein [Spirochaetaceae bacterium]
MKKRYALGVDGGGTKTDFLLCDPEGRELSYSTAGPSNHECIEGGMEGLARRFPRELTSFLAARSLGPEDVESAVFGMAGADLPSQISRIEEIVASTGLRNFKVINDSFLGVKAGSRKGYGICLVNGTGNTVGGIDPSGRWAQIAGTGYMSGEEGGAGRIAQRAMRAAYDDLFRLGEKTVLTGRLFSLFGINDSRSFVETTYRLYERGASWPREVLRILFTAGNEKDAVALRILREVGSQMGRSVAGCAHFLDFGDEIDVVIVGSVALKATCPAMMDSFRDESL